MIHFSRIHKSGSDRGNKYGVYIPEQLREENVPFSGAQMRRKSYSQYSITQCSTFL